MHRRRFLALSGAAITGVWVSGAGLIRLDRRMVIELSGWCSFCDKTAETLYGMAGVVGRPERICNECLRVCLEILFDDLMQAGKYVPSELPAGIVGEGEDISDAFWVTEDLRHDAWPQGSAELGRTLKELREMLGQTEPARRPKRWHDELACSFCDQRQSAVTKLIAGPTVFICDGCIGEATALLGKHA